MKPVRYLSFALLCAFFFPAAAQHIIIHNPLNNSSVPQYGNTVTFSTTGSLTVGYSPVVFVRSPDGGQWPYLGADQNRSDWTLNNVQFGITANHHKIFRVAVIIISDQMIDHGFDYHGNKIYIQNNTPLSQEIFDFLCNSNAHSTTVYVTRL
ncbi:MAG TPA: hypothetical protein VFE53_03215 [Mucilaginibacter sp.]|jgi:hypothetical protein|nr:hypothetical protein [Mucilaginibacter sp.]